MPFSGNPIHRALSNLQIEKIHAECVLQEISLNSLLPMTPTQKRKLYFYCRLAVSDILNLTFSTGPFWSMFLPTIVAHACGDPLSRYTCRATRVAADFLRILGFFRCSSSIALHPPLKGPVAPVAFERPGVSHVKLPLKRRRATGGCSSYTCGCRATPCN